MKLKKSLLPALGFVCASAAAQILVPSPAPPSAHQPPTQPADRSGLQPAPPTITPYGDPAPRLPSGAASGTPADTSSGASSSPSSGASSGAYPVPAPVPSSGMPSAAPAVTPGLAPV